MKTAAACLTALSLIALSGCSDSAQKTGAVSVNETEASSTPAVDPASTDQGATAEGDPVTMGSAYVLNASAETIGGEPVGLDSYRGKVILVVNTASQCGLTPQYAQLQAMYEQHKEDGLVILGFPSNDFNQERGTNEDIAEFCDARFGVTFPMFSKVVIKGEDAHPLYAKLNALSEEPSWNFTKYLIDRDGNFVERFDPRTTPNSEALTSRVAELLAQPAAG
jgi:glutathione peroxidase